MKNKKICENCKYIFWPMIGSEKCELKNFKDVYYDDTCKKWEEKKEEFVGRKLRGGLELRI